MSQSTLIKEDKRQYTITRDTKAPQAQSLISAQSNLQLLSTTPISPQIIDRGWRQSEKVKGRTGEPKHTNLEEESSELVAEGVHLLGAELVLLLPHGLPLLLILDEPRPQLTHLDRRKRSAIKPPRRTSPQGHIDEHTRGTPQTD